MGQLYRITVRGVVQGVGFRPFIYREARRRGLVGYVLNTGDGVLIIVNDKHFTDNIEAWPPLARIDSIEIEESAEDVKTYRDFEIIKSEVSGEGETQLPPDIFTCDDCLREMRDPDDRRYGYFFITCTNCGPRFSMIRDYPYDRPNTAMADFPMCEECSREYTDPADRRYHAQTIACHSCGPDLKLLYNHLDLTKESDHETIRAAVDVLKEDAVISIKGVGGFHLCARATEDAALKVRYLLQRPDKPFAMMMRDRSMVQRYTSPTHEELQQVESAQRPIVLLKKREATDFAYVSELDTVGVMLPYTALHALLFDYIDEPLIMTSANMPGEPVSTSEEIGEYFLTHNRAIVNRCDDSVIKMMGKNGQFLRRSRGFVPQPIKLPFACPDTIALGGESDNTICVVKGNNAYISQYIGDTTQLATFEFFKDTVQTFVHLTRARPTQVVCDLHPEFQTTLHAQKLADEFGCELTQVQHHKAHVAAVAAEHNRERYVGIACDGLGYGEDDTMWGGEVFEVKNDSFRRIGRLERQPMLGGDSATKHPPKMLFGILSGFLSYERLLQLGLFSEQESRLYSKQLQHGFNVTYTSSTGRVLDAVAAYLQLCTHSSYEGRPAMLLESAARDAQPLDIEPRIEKEEGMWVLRTTPLFETLIGSRASTGCLAATAHHYITEGLLRIAGKSDLPIVFGGGTANNRIITGKMKDAGVLTPREVPAGDGGLSFGQAVCANR